MGRLSDRLPATEQTLDDPAHVSRPAGVDLAPEESRDEALARLQSTVGNDGMAAMVGGQTPGGAGASPAALDMSDAGPALDGSPAQDVDPAQEVDSGQDAGPTRDGGPAQGGGPARDGGPAQDGGPARDGGPAQDGGPTSDGGTQPGVAAASDAGVSGGAPGSGGASGPAPAPAPQTDGGAAPGAAPGPGTADPQTDTGGSGAPPAPAAALTDEPGPEPDTGAADLDAPALDLVDDELVEHERWAAAGTHVGGAGSEGRADFIAGEVGAGMGDSFGDAFVMGLGMTVGIQAVEESIPGIGQIVGGVFAARAIAGGALGRDVTAMSHMGEGRSGYEEAANDIEGICAILDMASNIINVLAGLAGVLTLGLAVAAFFTFGALAPLAIAVGDIALALGATGAILGVVKMALQPLVVLFRSLHAFTSQADPREIEAQGHLLEEGGKEMGGALGGLAGAAAGGPGRGGGHEPEEAPPSTTTEPTPAAPAARTASGELTVEAEPIPGTTPLEPVPGSALPTVEPVPGTATPHETPPGAPENPFANLSDAEIDQAVSAAPRGETTPADFTEGDIDALVGRLDRPEQLETPMFASAHPVGPDVVNPVTGLVEPKFGLSNMTIEGQNVNPNQIGYHENAYFRGVTDVREINAFPTGPNPELPPAAQPPSTVPETTLQIKGPSPGPNQPRPVLSEIEGGHAEQRYHGPNPGAPEGSFSQDNPTVQVNTPSPRGRNDPWAGQPVDEAAGQRGVIDHRDPNTGFYRTAEGEWVRIPDATPAQRASAHYPVYGESTPILEPPTGGGVPPTEAPPASGSGAPPADLPSVIIDEAALGLQPGEVQTTQGTPRPPARATDVDWSDPRVRSALGLDPVTGLPTGAKLSGPGLLETDPNVRPWDKDNPGAPGPYHGSLGQMKDGEYAPESFFQVTESDGYAVRVGPPGAFVDHVFPTQAEAEAYASQVAGTGEAAIRDRSGLPHGWDPKTEGNAVDATRVFTVPAGTPTLGSAAAPQPEGAPAFGRPTSYEGGGPQTQLPKNLFPRGANPGDPSPAQVGSPVPIPDRAEGWFTRAMQYPGNERGAALHEQAERIEHATRPADLADQADHGAQGGALLHQLRNGQDGGAHHEEGGNEPVVETVNPHYEPPPGTQADIDRLTADVRRLRAAQSRADQERAHAERVRGAAQAQALSVQQARDDVTETLAGTQAHQGDVQEHAQANQHSAAQHEEGGGKVQDAGSQLAGTATLETLLAGWTGFTGTVLRFSSVLPDRAVNAFQQMNNDSTNFMARLAHIKTTVAGQQGQQPARGAQIAQTGDRITATGARAEETQGQLTQAQQRGADLAQLNQEHIAVAEQDRSEAADNASRADTAATDLLAQRQTLADQMAAWAAQHRAARQAAVDEAAQRLEERGLRVTHRPEQ